MSPAAGSHRRSKLAVVLQIDKEGKTLRARRHVKNLIFSLPFTLSKFLRYHALKPFDFLYPKLRKQGLPPMSLLRYGGYGTSLEMARGFADLLVKECDLSAGSVVLDLGCGAGLIDVLLLKLIGPTGRLCGLDIIEESVEWCTRNIQTTFPNSEFEHAAVFNASYNPVARTRAEDYRLPYANATFDVVLLKSVFTHMRPAEVRNYLSEISRVMKPRRRALITFFVLNTDTNKLIADGRSSFDFSYDFEGCKVINPTIPEDAIAYQYDVLTRLFEQYGLTLKLTLWGNWRGSGPPMSQSVTAQDVLFLEKN
jgi:ubiquinone/menaquinone biosynthesis C-methylase UbiE